MTQFSPGVIFLPPAVGREYAMGPMHSVFKADGDETDNRYAVSEWWVEPAQPGPGPHAHDSNEEIFYVIEGVMRFQIGAEFVDAPRGTFIRIPAGVIHDFENRTERPAGVLNIFLPGGFEPRMPEIVKWFEENAAKDEPR